MIRVYPYKTRSQSARELRDRLNAGRMVLPHGRYVYRSSHVILNWGNSTVPDWDNSSVAWINHPFSVHRASNKKVSHRELKDNDVNTLPTTENIYVAQMWKDQGYTIIERHLLQGHSGQGIVVVNPDEELNNVSLYSKYIGERREYRVHVYDGEIIYVQQKKRRNGARELPTYSDVIRNHGTGWVYCADDMTPLPDEAGELSIKAVSALNLTFGAVDIATRQGESYVIEVNTAPGLEGRSTDIYLNKINSHCRSILSDLGFMTGCLV